MRGGLQQKSRLIISKYSYLHLHRRYRYDYLYEKIKNIKRDLLYLDLALENVVNKYSLTLEQCKLIGFFYLYLFFRDLLYLDLALENVVRAAAERGSKAAGDNAAALVGPLVRSHLPTLNIKIVKS